MSRHQHHHHNKGHHSGTRSKPRAFNRSWFFIAAVILMFIAMGVYVLTMDESVVPEPVPTAPVSP